MISALWKAFVYCFSMSIPNVPTYEEICPMTTTTRESDLQAAKLKAYQDALKLVPGLIAEQDAKLLAFQREHELECGGFHLVAERWGDQLLLKTERLGGLKDLVVVNMMGVVRTVLEEGHAPDRLGKAQFFHMNGNTTVADPSDNYVMARAFGNSYDGNYFFVDNLEVPSMARSQQPDRITFGQPSQPYAGPTRIVMGPISTSQGATPVSLSIPAGLGKAALETILKAHREGCGYTGPD